MSPTRIFLSLRVLALPLLLLGAGGCSYGKLILEGDTGSVTVEADQGRSQGQYEGYESRSPRIPPGQMPPPGKCRIWFPGEPPGQQPPPGDCSDLERQVPPGALLIRG